MPARVQYACRGAERQHLAEPPEVLPRRVRCPGADARSSRWGFCLQLLHPSSSRPLGLSNVVTLCASSSGPVTPPCMARARYASRATPRSARPPRRWLRSCLGSVQPFAFMRSSMDPFQFGDEFGPRQIIYLHEPAQSLRAVVVIDNVVL